LRENTESRKTRDRQNVDVLQETAGALVAPGKGILAADESDATITKRFRAVGIESTPDTRRAYRELLFTTPGIAEHLSGVILFDETIRQSASDGTPFPELLARQGIIPGIKVDRGAKPLALADDETVTEGLDGLRERLEEYRGLGARFAKWRAVITIGEGRPSEYAIWANAHALARYAALCQEADIVPIVEPEVLMDGAHTIDESYRATSRTQHALFTELHDQRVVLEGTLLKPNMVLAGYDCPEQASVEEVAQETIRCLRHNVPAALAGVVFLSGGQDDLAATAHLDAMTRLGPHPWQLSFSYARALQNVAMELWRGDPAGAAAAQQAFLHRARMNGLARSGGYSTELEQAA
jgi:fructose-bisphosphate aldolase, class I